MGKSLQDYFAVNPLEDPTVKSTLEQVRMDGQQLTDMSVKELNRRLTGCSSHVVSKLKKCRRTLKNRGYAKNCRIKRIVAKSELEKVNAKLRDEIFELKRANSLLHGRVKRLLANNLQPEVVPSCNGGPATGVVEQPLKGELQAPQENLGDSSYSHEMRQQHDFYPQQDIQRAPYITVGEANSSTCDLSPSSSNASSANDPTAYQPANAGLDFNPQSHDANNNCNHLYAVDQQGWSGAEAQSHLQLQVEFY